MFKRITPFMFLVAALAFVAAPDGEVAAATCGGPGEKICKEDRSCAYFIFFNQCTTTYDYWSTGESGGGAPPEPPSEG
ncbi:MAG: hypothetical protein WD960_11245 [Gemmatimonadota bacterium]